MPKTMKRSNGEAKIRKDVLAIIDDPDVDGEAYPIATAEEIFEKLNKRYTISLADVKRIMTEMEREDDGAARHG